MHQEPRSGLDLDRTVFDQCFLYLDFACKYPGCRRLRFNQRRIKPVGADAIRQTPRYRPCSPILTD